MYTEGETHDVDSLLNVGLPVASFLAVANGGDTYILELLTVGRLGELREERFAGVGCTGEEVNHLLLGLLNGLAFLLQRGDALVGKQFLPVPGRNLYLVFDGGCVLQLRLLGRGNELLDIIPTGLEDRGIIRDGIIRVASRRDAGNDGKLTVVSAGIDSLLKVAPRIEHREKRNTLVIIVVGCLPVSKNDVLGYTGFISWREAAVDYFFAENGGDGLRVLGEDQKRNTPTKVLEVEASTEEIVGDRVLEKKIVGLLLHLFRAAGGIVSEAATVADFSIEGLTGGKRFVGLYFFEDVIRQKVIVPPWNNLGMLVDTEIWGVDGLFEKSGSIRNEDRSGIDPGKVFNRGYKIRIVHTFAVLCCKGTDKIEVGKRRVLEVHGHTSTITCVVKINLHKLFPLNYKWDTNNS